MKKLILLIIIGLMYMNLPAQDSVTIGKYEKFTSKILGGKVTYLVHLPEGYEKSVTTYPVIFTMNGQDVSGFANNASIIDNLSGDRIPDMILIGISNTGPAANYWSCPDDSGSVSAGNRFYMFLKDEFIPEISKKYRTNAYRILYGQSNSGLFAMYNFLTDPDLFKAYVVASPMFGWCPDFFINKTRAFLKDHPQMRKKLYISYGDLDYIQVLKPIQDFTETMKQSPAGLEWKVDKIENASHVPFSTLNNALLFFFSGCTMNAERKKLSVPEIKAHFEVLSADYGFTVNPKGGVLFDMAIDLGDENKTGQAIDVSKYLVSLYPDSEHYICYLGNLYQKQGDLKTARECYTKALKINPDYERAKVALRKLDK